VITRPASGICGRMLIKEDGSVVRIARSPAVWARRSILAAVLLAAAVIPGKATSSPPASHCLGYRCQQPGSILWTRALPGSWIAEDGVTGTVPDAGGAYAASAGGLAVLGHGTSVTAYQVRTGELARQATLSQFPPGAVIVSIRAWPGAVAVGVAAPVRRSGQGAGSRNGGGQNGAGGQASQGPQAWYSVILSAVNGTPVRTYPTVQSGGAVWAGSAAAVIVGNTSVTSYANATGRVVWSRTTGGGAQAWTASGRYLYVAQSAGGYLSASPVTALRQIDLRTGAVREIRPVGRTFPGSLTAVVSGLALFSGSGRLAAYDAQTGRPLWRQRSAVVELVDRRSRAVYVNSGNSLRLLSLTSGQPEGAPVSAVSASLYAVNDGVALGLDQGQGTLGEAWGYSMISRKVVWTSAGLPYPHFFVDTTGLGGSISSDGHVVLLTTCAAQGAARANNVAVTCQRPVLAALVY
jgi:PQQ-like domain